MSTDSGKVPDTPIKNEIEPVLSVAQEKAIKWVDDCRGMLDMSLPGSDGVSSSSQESEPTLRQAMIKELIQMATAQLENAQSTNQRLSEFASALSKNTSEGAKRALADIVEKQKAIKELAVQVEIIAKLDSEAAASQPSFEKDQIQRQSALNDFKEKVADGENHANQLGLIKEINGLVRGAKKIATEQKMELEAKFPQTTIRLSREITRLEKLKQSQYSAPELKNAKTLVDEFDTLVSAITTGTQSVQSAESVAKFLDKDLAAFKLFLEQQSKVLWANMDANPTSNIGSRLKEFEDLTSETKTFNSKYQFQTKPGGPYSLLFEKNLASEQAPAKQKLFALQKRKIINAKDVATCSEELDRLGLSWSNALKAKEEYAKVSTILRQKVESYKTYVNLFRELDAMTKTISMSGGYSLAIEAMTNMIERMNGIGESLETFEKIVEEGEKKLGNARTFDNTLQSLKVRVEKAIAMMVATPQGTANEEIGHLSTAFNNLHDFVTQRLEIERVVVKKHFPDGQDVTLSKLDQEAESAAKSLDFEKAGKFLDQLRSFKVVVNASAIRLYALYEALNVALEPSKTVFKLEYEAAVKVAKDSTKSIQENGLLELIKQLELKSPGIEKDAWEDRLKKIQIAYDGALKHADDIQSHVAGMRGRLEKIYTEANKLAGESKHAQAIKKLPELQKVIDETEDAHLRFPYTKAKASYDKAYTSTALPKGDVREKVDAHALKINTTATANVVNSSIIETGRGEIESLEQQLPEILKFAKDATSIIKDYNLLLATRLRSQQKKSVEGLHKAAYDNLLTDATEANKQLQALKSEIATINQNNVNWKSSTVPKPTPTATSVLDTAMTQDQARQKAAALIKNGGITLQDISKMIPSGKEITFRSTLDYPDGFKHRWSKNGVQYEIYGHGKSPVPDTQDSAHGNIVRVKVNGYFLQSDGTLSSDAFADEGHLSIY